MNNKYKCLHIYYYFNFFLVWMRIDLQSIDRERFFTSVTSKHNQETNKTFQFYPRNSDLKSRISWTICYNKFFFVIYSWCSTSQTSNLLKLLKWIISFPKQTHKYECKTNGKSNLIVLLRAKFGKIFILAITEMSSSCITT